MSDTATASPTLSFQLAGSWNRIDLSTDDAMTAAIREYVAMRLRTADADAQARRLLRARLTEALGTARTAGAVSALIASEITPGIPMPIMLTIYSPRTLRMTPAVGNSPEAVSGMLRTALTQLGIDGMERAASLSIAGSEIVRVVREQVDPVHPDAPGHDLTTLLVDYWYTVPGSKQVVLANFATPLSDIREVMLSFFDATVRASHFAAVR